MISLQVAYFNNYLADPKRPQNLEVKPQPSAQPAPPREERRERERGIFIFSKKSQNF